MKKILNLIFLFVGLSSFAQITAPHITNYTTKDYGALKSPEVWSITQDNDGLMYFGFVNEIGVFDGENWNFISLENTLNITSLSYHNGRLYYGAYGKFGYLEADSKGHLTNKILSNESGVFSNIWRIHYLNGVTYFQSYEGVFAYNGETTEGILPKTSFHLSFTCNNKLFIRQRDVGLMQINGLDIKLINAHPLLKDYGLFEAFQINEYQSFIVTMEKGLQKTSQDLSSPLDYLCADSCEIFNNKGIIGGVQLTGDLFALYSSNQGCFFSNGKGEFLGLINQQSGLASDEIKAAFVDDNGKLWLATGNGVSKVEVLEPFEFIGENFGVNGNVQCLTKFKGDKYVGTSLGLAKEDTVNRFFFKKTNLKEQIWDIQVVGEKMYVATSIGFFETSDGINFSLKYAFFNYGMFYPTMHIFDLVMEIFNPEFYSAMGINNGYISNGVLNRSNIEKRLKFITTEAKKEFRNIDFRTENVNYSGITEFYKSLMKETDYLNYTA